MTDISYSLICAVREGRLEKARELITTFGLSYSQAWSEGYVLLRDAIERKHTEIIKLLLTNGSKVNSKNKKNTSNTPLHFAVINGDIEIVKMLLDRGANVNAKNQNGITPLYNAIENKKIEIIELLLNRGANFNVRNINCTTPFHITPKRRKASINSAHIYTLLCLAVEKGHETIVKMLLEQGANINAKDKCDRTLLHNAIENEKMELTELLLNRGANVNIRDNDGLTPLHIAAKKRINYYKYGPQCFNVEKVVKMLLNRGANIDAKDEYSRTPLHTAIKNEKMEVTELFLNRGANVKTRDNDGVTPLHIAAKRGYFPIDEYLIEHETYVNSEYVSTYSKKEYTPLNVSAKKRQETIVKMLLDRGANIDAKDKHGRTPLYNAIQNDKMDITELLLNRGTNVNVRDNDDITPLHIAAERGYLQIVEHLLEHNADVNSVDKSDRTPLHFSAQNGNELISKMLLNKGANVNAKQKDRITALHIATQEDHVEVVEVLLECGAKVDSKDENDMTPLHIAVQKGHLEIVEILLNFGADIDSRDKYGRTALHIASKEEHTDIVIVLLEHGSDVNIINKNNDTPLDVVMAGISSFYDKIDIFNYDFDNIDDYDDFGRDIWESEQLAKILKQYVVKMKTANLYVSEQNFSRCNNYGILDLEDKYEENLPGSIWNSKKAKDFQDKCAKEVAIMKSEKISNTNISFYDIFTKNINLVATYMWNEDIVQVLKSDNYKTKFPLYASMVENHFRKGMKRKELLEQSSKNYHVLFNNLPYVCIDKIFSYLSDEDLRILIDACKPLSVNTSNSDPADTYI